MPKKIKGMAIVEYPSGATVEYIGPTSNEGIEIKITENDFDELPRIEDDMDETSDEEMEEDFDYEDDDEDEDEDDE